MKRFSLLAQILLVVFAVFTAMNAAAAGGTQPQAATGPRELTISRIDMGAAVLPVSYNDGLPVWKEVERRLNLKINWEVLPAAQQQYNTSAQARLASGQNLPDLMQLPTNNVTDVIKYADQGLIIKLNNLINSNAPDIVKMLKENPEVAAGITDPDGNIYFVTNYLLDSPNGMGMIIRKDLLDKMGLKVPITIDDWYKTLTAFKTTNFITPTSDIIPLGGNPRFMLSGFGIPVQQSDSIYFNIDANDKIYFNVMRDEFRDYLVFMNKLNNERLIDPMYGTPTTNIGTLQSKGLVPAFPANPGGCDTFADQIRATVGGDPLFVWEFTPVGPDGKSRWAPLSKARSTQFMGITKDCKNPALAIEFLNYIWANKDGVRLNLCGIEGTHYNIVNGKIQFTDDMIKHPQYNIIARLRQVGAFDFLDIQTGEFNIARGVGQYKVGLEYIEANPGKHVFAIPSFIPTSSEQSVVNDLWPDLRTYIDEMTIKFIKGTEPLSNFNAFRNKVRDMGIDKLSAEYQKMYDRYKKVSR